MKLSDHPQHMIAVACRQCDRYGRLHKSWLLEEHGDIDRCGIRYVTLESPLP